MSPKPLFPHEFYDFRMWGYFHVACFFFFPPLWKFLVVWILGVSLQNDATFASAKHIWDSARFLLHSHCRVFCTSKGLYVWALNPYEVQAWAFIFPPVFSSPRENLFCPWFAWVVLLPRPPFPGDHGSWLFLASGHGGIAAVLFVSSSFHPPCMDVNISPWDWIVSLSLTLAVENLPEYFDTGTIREKYYHAC